MTAKDRQIEQLPLKAPTLAGNRRRRFVKARNSIQAALALALLFAAPLAAETLSLKELTE
jgi:hypothetical protein